MILSEQFIQHCQSPAENYQLATSFWEYYDSKSPRELSRFIELMKSHLDSLAKKGYMISLISLQDSNLYYFMISDAYSLRTHYSVYHKNLCLAYLSLMTTHVKMIKTCL